jgi:hypothetical protein
LGIVSATDQDAAPDGTIELGPHPLVLLGAGASVEAGIPATFDMTNEIVSRVGRMAYNAQIAQALNFVCGALVAYDTASGKSLYGGLDVERVFSAVELLAERRELEVTPFVSSWHPAVDIWDRQRPSSSFDRDLQRSIVEGRLPGAKRTVEELVKAMTGVGSGETYKRLAHQMITELRLIVASRPEHLDYLAPLADAASQLGGLWVATLNYDLAVEQIGAIRGVGVDTGIEDWIDARRWHWDSTQGLKLLKLHGSIDWCWNRAQTEAGHMPMRTVERTSEPESEQRDPVLIFGQRGKLQAEGPFLSLLAEFEYALAKASRLIVIGYSFRDPHINDIVRRWTRSDQSRTIVLVDPTAPDQSGSEEDFRSELILRLKPATWNHEPGLPDRIDVRQLKASEAFAGFACPS